MPGLVHGPGPAHVSAHLAIYECIFMENSQINRIPIIAQDMTQALAKLDQYTQFGIPEAVLQYMLGNERFS